MHTHFKIISVEKLPESEAVITGELTQEFLSECRKEALKELGSRVKIPGFRRGYIPEDTLVKNLGEMKILEETAEVALGREYGNIVKAASESQKITPIGRPAVSITKLAPGIPLEFKMTLTLEPEFTLPDYKKIAGEVRVEKMEGDKILDKEVDDVLEEMKKRDWKPELKEGEDLKEKVRENLVYEKNMRSKEKARLSIVEGIVKATDISIPKVLVEAELTKMINQFKEDVSRHGVDWNEYLKSIKKSEEEVKTEWGEKARDRAKAELIISRIAEAEKLEPEKEAVEHEAEHLLSHYKDADPLRARIYVYQMLRNEKVLEFLESLAVA